MKTDWTVPKLKAFEKNVFELFKAGKINAPVHLCGGNEKQLISIFKEIEPHDWIFSTHRNHYHYLLKGGSEEKLLDEIMGKPTGICKGFGRSMHIYDKELNFYTSAIVAGVCAVAVGVAMGLKQEYGQDQNSGRPCVWCFVGDGAEDSGHFVEAVRLANYRLLPITFIVEDNNFSIDSTKADRWHLFEPIEAKRVLRYNYKRTYPHVGIGTWVDIKGEKSEL